MKQIALLMGGYSQEASISVKSAEVIFENLDPHLFEVYKVLIAKNKWVLLANNKEYPINKADFSTQVEKKNLKFDGIFNTIHGIPGENGLLQAYFELIGIPFTGSGFYASALTFNKKDCIELLKNFGVESAPHFFLKKGDLFSTDEIIKKVGLPLFVKPNSSGSSLGASKVMNEEKLVGALHKAFKEDNEILIESFLQGREFSIGVITFQGKIKVLPITEIKSQNDFFDYKAKYEGQAKEITPAAISIEMNEKLSNLARKIYEKLQLKGFARAEFIVVDSQAYFLEINTTPGLSKESILPAQALKAGISLKELVNDSISSIFN